MKKIKVVFVTTHFDITGIGSVIMNYCKALNKEQFDLTVMAGSPISEVYRKECSQYGIRIIELPPKHEQPLKHFSKMYKELKKNQFDIFHDHGNSDKMSVELTLAKLAGIKHRIAHCHNTLCSNPKLHKLMNPYFKKTYTCALACGELAGNWIFGEHHFEVLPNGFDTKKFVFSASDREKLRKSLHVENKKVIGHMGRVNYQKNQKYLIEAFSALADIDENVVLLMVGKGPDFDEIKDVVNKNRHHDRIILYGESANPASMYSCMDVFVLPSRYEGLPVVLLEAQMSGLPCVVSDAITREVDFGDLRWASIHESPSVWANMIRDVRVLNDNERIQYFEDKKEQIDMYNIGQTVNILANIYLDMMK